MQELPADLGYTRSHEWVRSLDDGRIEMGITAHAQAALGDLVFVDLPPGGTAVSAGKACAVVESVKAASDIYSPVDGEVVEANAALADQPELVNRDPYGAGWLIRIRTLAPPSGLLGAADYAVVLSQTDT